MSALLDDESPRTVLRTAPVDSSPPAGRDQETTRVGLAQVLLSLSLLLTWALVYLFFLSGFEQGHAQSALYDRFRTQLAEGTAPTGAPIEPGAPVAVLSAPDAGIEDLVVVEGVRAAQLQDGPGHVPGGVLPGQQGVSMLAGRSLSFGAPFKHITDLDPGSRIQVTTGQGVFTYTVVRTRVGGDPIPVAPAAGASRLTLRSTGTDIGGLQATGTVYVDAELAAGAVSAGGVAPEDAQGQQMLTAIDTDFDTTTLALLALALQLLVLALVGFAWAWSRWHRTAAWIAAGPCVLAALWLASSIGSRLLPGLV